MTDALFENHGSLFLCRPITQAAEAWIADNVGGEVSWFGGAIAVEPRYVEALIDGMLNDGLEVS